MMMKGDVKMYTKGYEYWFRNIILEVNMMKENKRKRLFSVTTTVGDEVTPQLCYFSNIKLL